MSQELDRYLAVDYAYELVRDREQGGFVAVHPDLEGCAAQGETAAEAVANLDAARRLWIETRLEDGLPVPEPPGEDHSGRVSLRMSTSLHASLARLARRQRVSLNQLLNTVLAEYAGAARFESRVLHAVEEIKALLTDPGRRGHDAAIDEL